MRGLRGAASKSETRNLRGRLFHTAVVDGITKPKWMVVISSAAHGPNPRHFHPRAFRWHMDVFRLGCPMSQAYSEDHLVDKPAIGLFVEFGWAVAEPHPKAGVAGEPRDAEENPDCLH
jgi:hypothetical protein